VSMIPVYVIHLPNPERKAKIAAELAKAGFTDITYVHAQEPAKDFTCNNMRRNPRGEFGCALSHLKALNAAHHQWNPDMDSGVALIIEDDVIFVDGAMDKILAATEYLSSLWLNFQEPMPEVLYLGGHPREPVKKTDFDGVVKVGKWSCAEAYVIDRGEIPYIVDFVYDRMGQPNAMFDFILGEYVASTGTGYALYPPITHQPPGWSHIGQKHDDKRELIERGWKANLPA
jgi:hypothetical protein